MRQLALILSIIAVPQLVAAQTVDVVTEEAEVELGSSRDWTFGPMDTTDQTALLEFTARTDAPTYSGSTYMLKVYVNGELVDAAKTRQIGRLLNKPMSYQYNPTLRLLWGQHGQWRVLYSPDFEIANTFEKFAGEAYRFILDVSDLVRADGENTLTFEHLGTPGLAAKVDGDIPLVLGMVRVNIEDGKSPLKGAADLMQWPVNRGEASPPPATYEHGAFNTGGFEITVGGVKYGFETRVSYPNAGFNHMEPAPEPEFEGQEGWSTTLQTGQDPLIVGRGPDYEVRRSITFGPRKVEVADTFVNLHDDTELGLIVRHQTRLNEERRVHLAGDPAPSKDSYYSPPNPSVFIAGTDHGIGMICEDDVFRNQATLFYDKDENATGLMTEMLYLPPSGEQTLRWSVYPVASDDYFDFINLVRQDWGSNFTVKGPWAFFNPDTIIDMPVEDLRGYLERLDITHMVYCGGWVDYKNDPKEQQTIGFGTYVTQGDYWSSFRNRLRLAIEKMHQVDPDITCLVYYDTQRDSWPDANERYPDSQRTNAQGVQTSTEWGGRFSICWDMVATLENSFGKAMLDSLDVYMGEIGADGIYWDEMEAVAYGSSLITHGIPDGHSCIIDPETYTVDHQVGVTTLLGEGHRLAVIDKVRAMGGELMGNGPAFTRAMLERQVQRMVEVQHNDVWCYEGNLDTPLGYASSRMDFGNFVRGVDLATLLVGTRYTYAHEVSPHLFPFTPIELHRGYMLGQERIIATHSGNYGWPGERVLVEPLVFDTEGMITAREFTTTVGDEARTAVELAEGEMVILKRLPITVVPKAGTATVANLTVQDGRASFTLVSDEGCTIQGPAGETPVAAGTQDVSVTL